MIPWTRGTVAGTAALSLAVGLASMAGADALRLDPVTGVDAPSAVRPASAPSSASSVSPEEILATVARDPFDPNRRRPERQVPADPESSHDPAVTPPPAAEPLRLVGTTLLGPGKGFALLARGQRAPEIVHIGGGLGIWRLRELDRGRVVLETGDSILVLEIPVEHP